VNTLTTDPPTARPVTLALAYRFTREDYHTMAETGILGDDDHVELIDGQIIPQMPIGAAHSSVLGRLTMWFASRVADRATVWVQNPIALDRFNEPEPDVALLRPRSDFYSKAHPAPEDVLLIIEVAESSLAFDREEKFPLYAAAGIPEVWLVDLVGKSLSVYRRPAQGTYTEVTRHHSGATIPIPGLPEAELAASDLAL
jgi:Uma2 family endonuclease